MRGSPTSGHAKRAIGAAVGAPKCGGEQLTWVRHARQALCLAC